MAKQANPRGGGDVLALVEQGGNRVLCARTCIQRKSLVGVSFARQTRVHGNKVMAALSRPSRIEHNDVLCGPGQRATKVSMSLQQGTGQARARTEADLPAASDEDLNLVRTVCQMVTRQFYSDQHVILVDILSNHLV